MAVTDLVIHFNMGETSVVHSITINGDDICEGDESEHFFSDIVVATGFGVINVVEPRARIFIDDLNDCRMLCRNNKLYS